jgi:hypothetical protein
MAAERTPWTGSVPVPGKETLWTPKQKSLVRANYVSSYASASPAERNLGKQFYPHWHEDAQHLGERLASAGASLPGTHPHEVGSAVLAHLSPSTEAEQNRVHAYQLTHLVETSGMEHLQHHLGAATAHAQAASSVRGSLRHGLESGSIEEGGVAHQYLQSQIDKHKAGAIEARKNAGIQGTPLGHQPSRSITNAMGAMVHHDPLSTLGSIKISDFGRSIADPHGYHRAPVDTHWHDAGLGRTDIPYDTARGLSASGRYNAMSNLATQAHQASGTSAGMPEFMATGWSRQQNLKVAENPAAAQARKSTVTKIGRMVSNKQFQHFLPEAHGMRPAGNKVTI